MHFIELGQTTENLKQGHVRHRHSLLQIVLGLSQEEIKAACAFFKNSEKRIFFSLSPINEKCPVDLRFTLCFSVILFPGS